MATILVVDDHALNRQFLVTLLGQHGHHVIEASDGREGVESARANHPDLVITDVLMPVLDGYGLVKQLRLDATTAAMPVMFYTAHYAEREARELAKSCNVASVLTKPAASADVLSTVNRVLSTNRGEAAMEVTAATFDGAHLSLLTDKLARTADELGAANARLRALINVGLDFAAEPDLGQRLTQLSASARELFGATYVTLGVVDRDDGKVQRLVTSGIDGPPWINTGDAVAGLLAITFSERRIVRGHNQDGDPATLALPVLHPPVRAFLAAPIASPAHVYGWICLVANEGTAFTEDDEELVAALAGQLGRIFEIEHVITKREQAEIELRRERDRAQRYLDTAEVILLALDLDGRVTQVNRYACTMLGYTAAELIGRDWETVVPPRAREQRQKAFDALLAGEAGEVENPIQCASGEERLIQWCNTLLRDDTGRVIGTFSSGVDVTERDRSADALRGAEERTRFALEAARVGIWDIDFATGAVQWSDILQAQHGVTPGTFGGTFDAYVACVHPDDRATLREAIAKAGRTGADFAVRYRAVWPDQTVRWIEGAGRIVLDEEGHATRGVGITLDVSERHRLEEQYHQAQKMDAIGRLAGGVAHDFNNLLTAILGYCELLLDETGPPHLQTYISEIHKAGLSATALTRQLLTFSRKQGMETTMVDMSRVVTEMRPMLGRLIREDVAIVLEPAAGACVMADRGQMEQIVMNLAINARDAMPSGGTLTIATENIELDAKAAARLVAVTPGPYIRFSVKDSGTGMTPQVMQRALEPFYTTKETGQGTGLGLAIVHGIVVQGGGTISLHSAPDQGTTVEVYLPRVECAAEAEAPTPAARREGGGECVLLVDDSEPVRQLTSRLLQRLGYRVLVAANAGEAIAVMEGHGPVDLVLTDVVMPGMSGPELVAILGTKVSPLKVIYMSGYSHDGIAHHGVVAPGVAFLSKPFTAASLAGKVRETLNL